MTELEVSRLAGQPVKKGHGLKHAGRGHALVGTGKSHASLFHDEESMHQVRRTPARLERGCVVGGLVIGEQSDEVVLVSPDIPDRAVPSDPVSLTKLVRFLVRAQVPIRELGVDELPYGVVHAFL